MTRRALIGLLALGSGVGFGGCADSHGRSSHRATVEPASTYKAGHGVQLTAAAANFIGLETSDFTDILPATALLRTVKGDFVYVANGSWFLRTPVTVVPQRPTGYVVKEGLYEGDVIARSGVEGLWLAELQAINGGVGCAHGH